MQDDKREREVLLDLKFRRKGSDILPISEYYETDEMFVDLHPSKPWVLFRSNAWSLQVWNYENGTRVGCWKIPEGNVAEYAKFIAQKDWTVVKCTESLQVYEFGASTLRRIGELRELGVGGVAVHHSSSDVLTGLYDGSIVLWDWGRKQPKIATFKGHEHGKYVTCVVFHPTESQTFGSASVDNTIKIWDMKTRSVSQTLRDTCRMGWTNTMQFHCGLQKSLLITAHDDGLVRLWDYKRGVLRTRLRGHEFHAEAALFHPHFPYIFSAESDGKIRVWRESDYRLVSLVQTGLERLSNIAVCKTSGRLILGGEGGFEVFEIKLNCSKLGRGDPASVQTEKTVQLGNEAGCSHDIEAGSSQPEFTERNVPRQEESSVDPKYNKTKQRKARAKLRKKERAQAHRVQQLEDEIQELKSEKIVLEHKAQELQARLENMIRAR